MHRLMFFFVIAFAMACLTADAQTSLRGTVIDGDDGGPLVGATVSISRLRRTARSDDQGKWEIKNLKAGKYFVVIHAVGHRMFHDTLTTDSARAVVLTGEDIHQDDVVVTAAGEHHNPIAEDASRTLRTDELDRVRKATVAQTLLAEPGMAMRSGGEANARPVVRGLGDQRVTILSDGLLSGDLSGGAPDHTVAIDANTTERIEILRGPASLQYGSNALTGILNVVGDDVPTDVVENSTNSAFLDGATMNGAYGLGMSTAHAFGRLAMRASASWRATRDVTTPGAPLLNSDARTFNGSFGLAYVTDSLAFGASYRVFSERYGIPVRTDSDEKAILNPFRSQVHVKADWQVGDGAIRTLSASGGINWYNHDERNRVTDQLATAFGLTSVSALLHADHAPLVDGGHGAVGASLNSQQYNVTGAEKLTPNGTYSGIAAFVYEQIPIGALDLRASARVEHQTISINQDTLLGVTSAQSRSWTGVFGAVGARYPVVSALTLEAELSQSFRAPTMEELASNNAHEPTASFDIGSLLQSPSVLLQPERGFGGDISLHVQASPVHGSITFYDNRIANFIYRAFRGDSIGGLPVYAYRQTDANLFGGEMKAECDFGGGVFATALADFVHGTRSVDNTNLPAMPPPRIALGVRYAGDLIQAGAEVRGALRQTNVSPEEIRLAGDADAARTAGNAVLNLEGGLRFIAGGTVHTVSLKIDNALDQAYRDHLSVIKYFALQPGRNVVVRYQVVF